MKKRFQYRLKCHKQSYSIFLINVGVQLACVYLDKFYVL
jgi:sRNA-binding regulator protein Hfq